jgi:hypothetical protein
VFERIMARLEVAEPGAWVVKGGMALEWRLGKRARGTRDLDLVLRGQAVSGAELRDRLVDLLAEDRGEDRFLFEVGPAQPLDVGFRFSVKTKLAGKEFATVRLDVATRGDELVATERLHVPGAIPELEQFSPPEVERSGVAHGVAGVRGGVVPAHLDEDRGFASTVISALAGSPNRCRARSTTLAIRDAASRLAPSENPLGE